MRIKIRGPSGQAILTFDEGATVADLSRKISETTSLDNFEVMYSYPPKPLALENFPKEALLESLEPALDGAQIIIKNLESQSDSSGAPTIDAAAVSSGGSENQEISTSKAPKVAASPAAPLSLERKARSEDLPEVAMPSRFATLVLRIMPDDNSCLFRAFSSAYFGAMDNMHELRSIIAQSIQADPDRFSAVVLEKSPDDYCRWIQNPDAWGGQIELEILSKHFDVEICSIDVMTLRVDHYNQGEPKRCILVYSGIHYDVIALSPADPPYDRAVAPPEFDEKVFESGADDILDTAVDLCKQLQNRGYYTNTASFTLRCNICGGMFIGEAGATEHAKQSGHFDFGEA